MHDKTLDSIFDNPSLESKALVAEVGALRGKVIAGFPVLEDSIAVTLYGYTMVALNKKNVTAKEVKEYIESLAKKPLHALTETEIKTLIVLGALKKKSRPFKALANTVGRNDICPCGSGLKFKSCCLGLVKAHDHEEYKKCLE